MEQIFQDLTDLMNETAELYMNGNPIVFVGVNLIFLCFAALLSLHIISIVKKCSQVATRKRVCELVAVDLELIKQLQITRYKHPIPTNKLLHHRERWTYERKDGSRDMRYNHNYCTPEKWEAVVSINGEGYSFQSEDRSVIEELKRQLNAHGYLFPSDISNENDTPTNKSDLNRQEMILDLNTFAAMLKGEKNTLYSFNSDFLGVYVLENTLNKRAYVGQSRNVLARVGQHIHGKGSPDVYYDFRSGDPFTVHLIPLEGSSYNNLNDMERDMIVVLLAGSAVDISEAHEQANAVLLGWYPGARGGKAIADLIFGKESPSGKLPVTFYYNEALHELPAFTDYSMTNRTYRYYQGKPLYPFGYGLTYGDVVITSVTASESSAQVIVQNRGERATQEVVQLYLKDEDSPDAPSNPILCGFSRLKLDAGEQKTIEIPIEATAFTVVNSAGERIPGSGNWTLYAHIGQPDQRTAQLTGKFAASTSIQRMRE